MHHYLLFKLNGKISAENFIVLVSPFFEQMSQEIPGWKSHRFRQNTIERKNNFDLLIQIELSKEALQIYFTHPLHLKMKEAFRNYIEKKAVFDDDEA